MQLKNNEVIDFFSIEFALTQVDKQHVPQVQELVLDMVEELVQVLARKNDTIEFYHFDVCQNILLELDWIELVLELVQDMVV